MYKRKISAVQGPKVAAETERYETLIVCYTSIAPA